MNEILEFHHKVTLRPLREQFGFQFLIQMTRNWIKYGVIKFFVLMKFMNEF